MSKKERRTKKLPFKKDRKKVRKVEMFTSTKKQKEREKVGA